MIFTKLAVAGTSLYIAFLVIIVGAEGKLIDQGYGFHAKLFIVDFKQLEFKRGFTECGGSHQPCRIAPGSQIHVIVSAQNQIKAVFLCELLQDGFEIACRRMQGVLQTGLRFGQTARRSMGDQDTPFATEAFLKLIELLIAEPGDLCFRGCQKNSCFPQCTVRMSKRTSPCRKL